MPVNNQKFYINDVNKTRECGICHKIMPFSSFGIEHGRPIAKCKPCRSSEMMVRDMEKKKDKYPNDYLQCTNDDCLKIWKFRRYNVDCPKCGARGEI